MKETKQDKAFKQATISIIIQTQTWYNIGVQFDKQGNKYKLIAN